MKIISEKISLPELREMAAGMFGNLVKAVVDIERNIMAVDGELHADEEKMLLEDGSRQENLWGINVYPEMDRSGPDFVEFDSMINLRPRQKNLTRGIDNPDVREKILVIIGELIS